MKARYQDVYVDPNEDLNIYSNICKILEYCWYEIDKFPTLPDISRAMGYCERHITALARANNLPHRAELIQELKYASNKKGTKVRIKI